MYAIIKNVINTKNYNLSDLLVKISAQWVSGTITETERDELFDLARRNADSKNDIDLYEKIVELENRIKALEEKSVTDNETEEETTPAEYVPGKWYYGGDNISFGGKVFTCTAPDGVVCVWSPDEYPPYWSEISA